MISYLKGIPVSSVLRLELQALQGLDPPATHGVFSVFDDRNIHEFLSLTWPPLQGILKGNHMMFYEALVSGRRDLPKLVTWSPQSI